MLLGETPSTRSRFAALRAELEPDLASLLAHPIYASVCGLAELRRFMEAHAFAVWDFMTLLKALQRRLTCTALPWTMPAHRRAARFINEIVLAEESDEVAPGHFVSHFELYLDAMAEVGAERSALRAVHAAVARGESVELALASAQVAPCVQRFVLRTMRLASDASDVELAAEFLFGREDPIPAMFDSLLAGLDASVDARSFRLYLARHVQVDGEQHGPAAAAMLSALCGHDEQAWRSAARAARAAIAARLALWDGVLGLLTPR